MLRKLAVAVSLALTFSATITDAFCAESAEAFLQRYFDTIASCTSVMQLKAFYPAGKDDAKMDEMMKDPAMNALALSMVKGEPAKVKILAKKEAPGKVTFSLAPVVIPKEFTAQSKQPGFSMTGEVILLAKDGGWLVEKDYWTVKATENGGKSTVGFGHKPDNDKGDMSDTAEKQPEMFTDYGSRLRNHLTEKWQKTGSGDSIYVIFKVQPDGKLTDIVVQGEKPQEAAQAQLVKLLESAQPLPALPADKTSTPYAWMMFNWSADGSAVSGPYFESAIPQWLTEKLHVKSWMR